jgi:RNA polymerase sigma-70 factor (ECF subfamily)
LRLHRFGLSRLGSGEARFWLFRVGRNLALNEMEKRQTRMKFVGKISEIFHARVPNPEEVLAQSESRKRVFDLLRDLPEHQRAALLLREQEEMSYGEIAEVLNVPPSKIKSDIFRARTLLRERWNDMNDRPARAI